MCKTSDNDHNTKVTADIMKGQSKLPDFLAVLYSSSFKLYSLVDSFPLLHVRKYTSHDHLLISYFPKLTYW